MSEYKTIYASTTKSPDLNTPDSYKAKCGFTYETTNNEYCTKFTFTIKNNKIKHNVNIYRIVGSSTTGNTTIINTVFIKNFQFKTVTNSKTINTIINDIGNKNYNSSPDNPDTYNSKVGEQIQHIEKKAGKDTSRGVNYISIGKTHEDGDGDSCGCGNSETSCLNSHWYAYLPGCSTYAYQFKFGYCNGMNETASATAQATITWYFSLPVNSSSQASSYTFKSGEAPSTFTKIYTGSATNASIQVISGNYVSMSKFCGSNPSWPTKPMSPAPSTSC